MKYRIKHVTTYRYVDKVSLCQNQAHLSPLTRQNQTCTFSTISVEPETSYLTQYQDYFGNTVTVFDVATLHDELIVTNESEVELFARQQPALFEHLTLWEEARRQLANPVTDDALAAAEFTLPTALTTPTPEIAAYATDSFLPGRGLVDACLDLNQRIFSDFSFDATFSTINTPLSEVMEHRKGVCQDFAHLALACLRSVGLAARYVSGYIETIAPEGAIKLEGADATHAWLEVWVPEAGWLELDPTNNLIPSDQHVVLAVGRDFADISPLKGVIFGGGNHQISVAVDMVRQAE